MRIAQAVGVVITTVTITVAVQAYFQPVKQADAAIAMITETISDQKHDLLAYVDSKHSGVISLLDARFSQADKREDIMMRFLERIDKKVDYLLEQRNNEAARRDFDDRDNGT